uniref:Uncharacterized protein n=1 Tax=Oryza brachyantha TaxID=4533 RepID=J3MKT7_ORYBR
MVVRSSSLGVVKKVQGMQSKATHTTCSTKCPNGSGPYVMARSSYFDEETAAPMVILEPDAGEDKDHASCIVTKDLPEVTPTKCSTKCSCPSTSPCLIVANTTCMELVAAANAIEASCIDTPLAIPRSRTPSV